MLQVQQKKLSSYAILLHLIRRRATLIALFFQRTHLSVMVGCSNPQCLGRDSPSPTSFQETIAHAYYVNLILEAVHLCQAAELPVFENTKYHRFLPALGVKLVDDFFRAAVVLFKEKSR